MPPLKSSETVVQPYDALIMDHIRNARNYRVPANADRRASGVNPLCGDDLTLYLRLEDDRIAEAAFQCACCGVSMASASVMTERVTGLRSAEARAVLGAFIATVRAGDLSGGDSRAQRAILDTTRKYPARIRCAVLPWATLEAALDNRQAAVFVR